MVMADSRPKTPAPKPLLHPFRRAVLKGLAVVLPPLLTIVIFVWVGNTIVVYFLEPVERVASWAIYKSVADVRTDLRVEPQGETARDGDALYKQVDNDKFVPLKVYRKVEENLYDEAMPTTARAIYFHYIEQEYLRREIVVPVFLLVFVLILYLLGKFLAAGVGMFFWIRFEQLIHQLPIIRNVYSSVKQVTDFLFSEKEVEYTRVVAVEYPRKGIWSLALVTGESMLDIRCAANEPVLSVLIPTSPMPFTGFTITVKKSESIDLNITIDQAFQFIISCGVVVPPHQLSELIEKQTGGEPALTGEASAALPASGSQN